MVAYRTLALAPTPYRVLPLYRVPASKNETSKTKNNRCKAETRESHGSTRGGIQKTRFIACERTPRALAPIAVAVARRPCVVFCFSLRGRGAPLGGALARHTLQSPVESSPVTTHRCERTAGLRRGAGGRRGGSATRAGRRAGAGLRLARTKIFWRLETSMCMTAPGRRERPPYTTTRRTQPYPEVVP